MPNKLKKYENFNSSFDYDYEKEIDDILVSLIKKKILISMLRDTVDNIKDQIKSIIPNPINKFNDMLEHYDDDVHESFGIIKDVLIDGFPNIIDQIKDLDESFNVIEEYLKNKLK